MNHCCQDRVANVTGLNCSKGSMYKYHQEDVPGTHRPPQPTPQSPFSINLTTNFYKQPSQRQDAFQACNWRYSFSLGHDDCFLCVLRSWSVRYQHLRGHILPLQRNDSYLPSWNYLRIDLCVRCLNVAVCVAREIQT